MSGGLVVSGEHGQGHRSPNVQRYVDGNLAGGVDHLVVFLDAPDDAATPEVRAWLEAHPHVTCVVTDDAWWTDKRPEQLNTRQRINANVVKALLSHGRTGPTGSSTSTPTRSSSSTAAVLGRRAGGYPGGGRAWPRWRRCRASTGTATRPGSSGCSRPTT